MEFPISHGGRPTQIWLLRNGIATESSCRAVVGTASGAESCAVWAMIRSVVRATAFGDIAVALRPSHVRQDLPPKRPSRSAWDWLSWVDSRHSPKHGQTERSRRKAVISPDTSHQAGGPRKPTIRRRLPAATQLSPRAVHPLWSDQRSRYDGPVSTI